MSEIETSKPSSFHKTGHDLAAHLRAIAERLDTLGNEVLPEISVNIGFQVFQGGATWPERRAAVDRVAALFGLVPERAASGIYRTNDWGGAHVYTMCPPPPEKRRAELLAQLAELEAEEAADRRPAPVMNGTSCEDITGENGPAVPAALIDPLAAASQQLRESTDAQSFMAGLTGLMDASRVAAQHEQGDHDDCDPATCGDAEKLVGDLFAEQYVPKLRRFADSAGDEWQETEDGLFILAFWKGEPFSKDDAARWVLSELESEFGPLVEVTR